MKTNIPGVPAARILFKQIRQISAVSDGMIAAINVEEIFSDEHCRYYSNSQEAIVKKKRSRHASALD